MFDLSPQSMNFGNFRLSVVRECTFKLDGGAMFGVVPKPLWHKVAPADSFNRIVLTCNLLLIEFTSKGQFLRVLVETGMGERWAERERERYEVKTLVDHSKTLADLGLTNEEIDAVVISHLHFDHAGGATRVVDGKLVPTYPRAKYYVQQGEWDLAHNANLRAKASYRMDYFDPLAEHNVLELIDGDREIYPGVWVRVTGGHTSHHQVVTFESAGKRGIFFADIIPTKCHLPPPWVMGYDHFPLASCDVKSKRLSQAADEGWLVVFDHEPGVPWGYVKRTGEGKFDFLPIESLSPV